MEQNPKKSNVDYGLMLPAIIITLLIVTPLVLFKEQSAVAVNSIFNAVTSNLKGVFLLYGFFCIAFLIWLAASRWGGVKLGAPEDKPEFSTYKWAIMIFCGGIGIGIARWAFVEPAYYMSTPPMHIAANSALATEWAGMLSLFHWGIIPWAIYTLPTFAIAYAIYVKKMDTLRLSTACKGILGKKADGIIGKCIDVLVIIGMMGGVGTSLGLAVPLVSALVAHFMGIEQSTLLQYAVLLAFVALVSSAVFFGLKKGMALLYDIKAYLAYFLLAFIFIMGPSVFILNTWVNSLGLLVNNFFIMSLWTDPITHSGFTEGWTVFYWAWWMAYSPMMGLFVAKISKGRTIREVVLGEIIFGSLGCWVFFAVFGGYSIHLQVSHILDICSLVSKSTPEQTIIAILSTLPAGKWFIVPIFAVMCLTFLSGLISTAAYTLSSQVSKELSGDEEPSRWTSTSWAIILGLFAGGLLATGGLTTVQLSSIVLSLPLMLVMILMVFSLMKWLKEDYGDLLNPKAVCIKSDDIKAIE